MFAISDEMTSTVQVELHEKSRQSVARAPGDEAELWQPAREKGGKFHVLRRRNTRTTALKQQEKEKQYSKDDNCYIEEYLLHTVL